MGLIVNTNIASFNAQRNVTINNNNLSKSLERLSSGLRINRAADDAAGLAIANKLRSQVLGLDQARRNANDGISLIQTAEGTLDVVTGILNRLKELAVQSASETNTTTDRSALDTEADQLVAELTRISETSEFNGAALLDGTFSAKKLQIGSNADQTVSISLSDSRARAMGKFASTTANIGDGISSPTVNGAGGLSAGEFTINGTNVVATSDSDDQVSVLSMSGTAGVQILTSAAGAASVGDIDAASGNLVINGTSIAISTLVAGSTATYASAGSLATDITSAINTASITNVTARVVGSFLVLETRNGANLTLQVSGVTATSLNIIASLFGNAATAFFGSEGATVTTYNGQSSAIAKAAAINGIKTTTTASAVVEENSITASSAIAAGSIASGDLIINGVNIGAVTVQTNDADGALVAAINGQSSNTGVVASVSNGALTLKAASGRNISITATTGASGAQAILDANGSFGGTNFTGATTVIRGSLTLKSTDNFTIGGTTTDIGSVAATTFVATGNLSTMDISTRSGANNAITQIESALKTVNSSRADIGAVQNRFELLIQNLMSASENQSAAESRIRDADFAFETARFTRNQILIQAGTSILAQANTAPQVALQLLG